MPAILNSTLGVTLSMAGCPNRCRHCYLGPPHPGRPTTDDLRWVVGQFRNYRRPRATQPLWSAINVVSWIWEPDFAPNYRELYELENELSGLPSLRPGYELLSIWRLARQPEYAEWAHSIGVRVCQMTFWGIEQATDWGFGRRGAFADLLAATERLLAVGIRPRWQWMITKKMLPDLSRLIELTGQLRLQARCEQLGGPFTLFLNLPSPDGSGWAIEHLRLTAADSAQVPAWLQEQSEAHMGGSLGEPEGKLVKELWNEEKPAATTTADITGRLFLLVMPNFDVYPNLGEMLPPWRLGNLKTDGLDAIIANFEQDRTPGQQALFHLPVAELARCFGRPSGQRIFAHSDLKSRWLKQWLHEHSSYAKA